MIHVYHCPSVYPSHHLSRAPRAEHNLQTYKMQDRTPGEAPQPGTRVWHQSNVERNLLNSSKNLARDAKLVQEENNLGTG